MIAPLLSIITVNYNNKSGLIRTLNSIKNQESVFFEHIIIDANSTDGSKDAILLYEKEITFPLYWVSEPDNGIYDGMNKGIKQAHGEYLFFLNSGDTLISNTILQEIALDGNKYIYGNIRYILSEKRINLAELAKKLGYNRSAASDFLENLEKGSSTIKTICKYANALEVDPALLVKELELKPKGE